MSSPWFSPPNPRCWSGLSSGGHPVLGFQSVWDHVTVLHRYRHTCPPFPQATLGNRPGGSVQRALYDLKWWLFLLCGSAGKSVERVEQLGRHGAVGARGGGAAETETGLNFSTSLHPTRLPFCVVKGKGPCWPWREGAYCLAASLPPGQKREVCGGWYQMSSQGRGRGHPHCSQHFLGSLASCLWWQAVRHRPFGAARTRATPRSPMPAPCFHSWCSSDLASLVCAGQPCVWPWLGCVGRPAGGLPDLIRTLEKEVRGGYSRPKEQARKLGLREVK